MFNATSRPKLAPKVKRRIDPITQRTVLLVPEKGLVLNGTAAAIAALCDGEHTYEAIVAEICETHPHADRERIEVEVADFLQGLVDRCLLMVQS